MPPQDDPTTTPPVGGQGVIPPMGQPVTPPATPAYGPMGTPAPVIPAEPETPAPMGGEEAPVAQDETPADPNQPAI